jgi:uncharacterized membrane protein (DUF2068 family)
MPQVPQSSAGHVAALRAVAVFEFAKGLLVMLLACGLFSLVHKDVALEAERLVRHFHLNPYHHFSRIFIDAASQLSSARLWGLAFLALAYSCVRFFEAYGLWHARAWAEWFALLSGAIYLPFEIYELVRKPTPLHWLVLVTNCLVVLYMAYVRWSARRGSAS